MDPSSVEAASTTRGGAGRGGRKDKYFLFLNSENGRLGRALSGVEWADSVTLRRINVVFDCVQKKGKEGKEGF